MTQIFVEPELENLSEIENSTEWQKICGELGLEAQLKFTEKSETKQAPPYMFIDKRTSFIIRTLCPVKVEYKDYKSSTIPLDVLQEIKKAKDNGWYENIYILSDDKSPDPFVIGEMSVSTWQKAYHLIARWGNELLPFEILEEKAIERLKNSALRNLNALKIKIDYAIANPKAFISDCLSGMPMPIMKFTPQNIESYSGSFDQDFPF